MDTYQSVSNIGTTYITCTNRNFKFVSVGKKIEMRKNRRGTEENVMRMTTIERRVNKADEKRQPGWI